MTNYSTLVEVAAMALGGGKDTKPKQDLSKLSNQEFGARLEQMLSI